ncbi:unnamed protein product [Diplocarpon coronariae]|uniref:BZIP transcription factor n=1 Tax=Diplocarpon coronariae TaxID=2795749 RepID=A0A218ZAM2_9HELO|nr:bZIP transcription factor [Marssonina coronariae]
MADCRPQNLDPRESIDNGDSAGSKAGPKRRASRAGTRSVASLTPEQLARKRANDREAQRSIRQRTKTHIEELEQRIRDLSDDKDARNFEQIKRRNAELEEELRRLRELLGRSDGSVASSPEIGSTPYQARYGTDGLEDQFPMRYSPGWSSPSISVTGPGGSLPTYPASSAGDLLSSFAPDHSGLPAEFSDLGSTRNDTFNSDSGVPNVTNAPLIPVPVRRGGFASRPEFARSRSYPHGGCGLPASHGPVKIIGGTAGIGSSPLTSQPLSPVGDSSMANRDTKGVVMSPSACHPLTANFKNARMASQMPQQNNRPTYVRQQSVLANQPGLAAWEIPIRFTVPDGPVDSILLGLLRRQKGLACESTFGGLLIGPFHPDLRALINPDMSNKVHPVSSVISNVFQRLQYPSLAAKVASLYLVYRFFQWQIWPTMETWRNMPEWFYPVASQLATAHPLWMSLLTWGKMRNTVIDNQDKYATEEFRDLWRTAINLNWPYGENDILVLIGEEVRITDAFMRHLEHEANWSLNKSFQQRYPELRGTCRFTNR